MYLFLLLLSIIGGVFITSDLFHDYMNDPKFYFILITTIVMLIICLLSRNGLTKLRHTLQSHHLMLGVIFICFFSSLLGLLQYCGFIPSNHSAFPITGTVENPAGFAAIQSLMFPFAYINCFDKNKCRNERLFSIAVSILCVLTIILSGSRAGALAICSVIIIVSLFQSRIKIYFKKHKWLLLPLVVGLFFFLVLLYYAKPDSANGRWFIWNRCFELIKERPLLGYGINGFHRNYMECQAKYFSINPDSSYIMLADNVRHPFNEYIKLTIQFGVIGLSIAIGFLMFVIIRLIKSKQEIKVLSLSIIVSIFILSMFSYPFSYSVVWLFSFIALAPVIIKKNKLSKSYLFRFLLVSVLTSFFIFLVRNMYYEMKWTEITKRSMIGKARRMIPNFEDVNRVMGNNPMFNYNYAVLLNHVGRYEESLTQAYKCKKKWNEYSIQILFANIFENLGQKEDAIKSYEMAHNMVPCRFEPLYGQFLIYCELNDTINILNKAYEITEKAIKVPSVRVSQIIAHAKQAQDSFSTE